MLSLRVSSDQGEHYNEIKTPVSLWKTLRIDLQYARIQLIDPSSRCFQVIQATIFNMTTIKHTLLEITYQHNQHSFNLSGNRNVSDVH